MLATLRAFSEVLLPIAVIVALGYTLRRTFELDVRTLNRVAIYLLIPCLTFATLLRAEVAGDEALGLGLQMLVVVGAIAVIAYLLAHALRLSGPQRSGFMLATSFMNSGNYGLPAIQFAFGEIGFQYGVIGFLIQALLSQTLAVYIASAGHGNRRAALVQVFRMPLIYAAALAIGLRLVGVRLDESDGSVALGLYRGVRLLADATLPFLLLILGMQLHQRQRLATPIPLTAATLLRLVGSVPIAYGAGLLLGLGELPLRVGVVQAAMPTAVNITILALEFNAWPEFVNNTVIVTTLASLVTLTVLIVLLS